MILTGNTDALEPIIAAIYDMVDRFGPVEPDGGRLREVALALMLFALGDSLMGAPMAAAVGLPRTAARDLAYKQLLAHAGVANAPALP